MKKNKNKDNDAFANSIKGFFNEYCTVARGISPNTKRSYRHAIVLFLDFMRDERGIEVEKLTLADVNRDNILDYLAWLEKKGNSVSTRNVRLAAIRSFCHYVKYYDVEHVDQWKAVFEIEQKKGLKGKVNYLTLEGLKLLFDQIPQNTSKGKRDLTLLTLLYETGARVSEIVGLRPMDIHLARYSYVELYGKGNKERQVPIQEAVIPTLREYMEENRLFDPKWNHRYLFRNYKGERLSPDGVTYILKKYASMARNISKDLIPNVLSPHCLRHSKAMHMLQAGINLVYIRDFLGHVSIQTTEIYARADGKSKREAMESAYTPVLPEKKKDEASHEQESELRNWLTNWAK